MLAVPAAYPAVPLTDGWVSLRPWTADAVATLAEAGARERDAWSPVPVGRPAPDWVLRIRAFEDAGGLSFVIGAGPSGRPVGLLTLGGFDDRHRVAEILGYWIAPQARGRGIAAAAVSLAARWATDVLGYVRIQIFTRPDNASSRRAARHAGFAEEGVLRSFVEVDGERSDAVVLSLISA